MQLIIAATLAVATMAFAAPTNVGRQGPAIPETVYGVDPKSPFYMSAIAADEETTYTLQPFYVDYVGGVLGLQAVVDGGPINATSPQANFTLTGSHYGTQLYAYAAGPCTSAAYCDDTPLQWSNTRPAVNGILTFHIGTDTPSFGGLNFIGAYHGGDFEAGETNYLLGAADTDWTKAFTVCDWANYPTLKTITYHGTDSSCVPVTVRAVQVGSF